MGKVKGKKVSAKWARRQRKMQDISKEGAAKENDENQNETEEAEMSQDDKEKDIGISSKVHVQGRKRSRRQSGEVPSFCGRADLPNKPSLSPPS